MASNTKHDTPALTSTVAARESTPVGEVSLHHASIKSRLPQSRRRSQSGTPLGRAGEPSDDYFAAPQPMKSRSHEDLRAAPAASAAPAPSAVSAPSHPTTATAPSHPTVAVLPVAPSAPVHEANLISPTQPAPSAEPDELAAPASPVSDVA